MKASWKVTTENGLCHFLTAIKVFNTKKGLRHYLKVFIKKNDSITFSGLLKIFKIAIL